MDIIISISQVFTISVRHQRRNYVISHREVVAAVTAGEMWLKAETADCLGTFGTINNKQYARFPRMTDNTIVLSLYYKITVNK